jgi:hypothetical protein
MTSYTIVPSDVSGSHKTGTLKNITAAEITEILGFEPNIADDPSKVVNSWGFTATDDQPGFFRLGIWDYKGSHRINQFSTYGESDVLKALFGNRYAEGW